MRFDALTANGFKLLYYVVHSYISPNIIITFITLEWIEFLLLVLHVIIIVRILIMHSSTKKIYSSKFTMQIFFLQWYISFWVMTYDIQQISFANDYVIYHDKMYQNNF